jgi:hypothetical protein
MKDSHKEPCSVAALAQRSVFCRKRKQVLRFAQDDNSKEWLAFHELRRQTDVKLDTIEQLLLGDFFVGRVCYMDRAGT